MKKISELMAQLEALKAKYGDIPIRVQSITHTWEPEPAFKKHPEPHIILNP